MGAELSIGFTVTGTREKMPLTVTGAQDGDVLILTRPIGSGVILAADMAGQADGRDVAAALAIMAQPQGREAAVLGRVATAMTDVTGFGLAGHILAICEASALDATLLLADIPVYAGARPLAERGISSSLTVVNRADAAVEGVEDALLFDPQTAGGMLASVPAVQVDGVLDALSVQGCAGHVIGRLSTGTGRLRVS